MRKNNSFDNTSKKTTSMHNKDKNNGNYLMGHNKYVMNASEYESRFRVGWIILSHAKGKPATIPKLLCIKDENQS